MADSNTKSGKQALVPNAKNKLDQMKYEVAGEIGVTLNKGYNGDIKSRDAGKIGGNMVKKMIAYAENNIPDNNAPKAF